MSLLAMAWRNIWRNYQRTLITLAAVALNTAILIVTFALMDGMMHHMIQNATQLMVGEAQIHAPGYSDDQSFYKSIPNVPDILDSARRTNIGAAPRSYGYGLISIGTKSNGAQFWGVDPQREKAVFDLAKNMAAGRYLSDTAAKGIVLGKKLARSLNAAIGTEIIAVVQAADGSLGSDIYRVVGILKTVGDTMDRSAAILHEADFEQLFVSGGRIHEIALNTKGELVPDFIGAKMSLNGRQLEVKTWHELMPVLSDMVNIFDTVLWIFGGIFFLAAGLGIMNTMLMATYERIHEFGILKAIGTSPVRVVAMIASEAFLLTVVASLLGMTIGFVGASILENVGIDTRSFASDFSFSGVAFNPIWRAVVTSKTILLPVIVMCITCTLSALYPAIIAARLDPVRAIHHR